MKHIWKVLEGLFGLGVIFGAYILYRSVINTPTFGPLDHIVITVLASMLALCGLLFIVLVIAGNRIMRFLYGKFSNRNSWGR